MLFLEFFSDFSFKVQLWFWQVFELIFSLQLLLCPYGCKGPSFSVFLSMSWSPYFSSWTLGL
jgi:hypothetical protein